MLQEIVYRSTATGSTTSLLNMATLLAEAQWNNQRRGLTGALAAHDEVFFQVLEGPADVLDSLLARLSSDPRHKDLQILGRRPIEARRFGDWSMAHARINPAQARSLETLTAEDGASAARIAGLLRETAAQG